MKLKSKMVIVLVAIMIILTLAYYGIFRLIILKSFSDLDERMRQAQHGPLRGGIKQRGEAPGIIQQRLVKLAFTTSLPLMETRLISRQT